MEKRFVTIWFRFLKTDWLIRRQQRLLLIPFVLQRPEKGRLIITATNAVAEKMGIHSGMPVADARAIYPGLEVFDDDPLLAPRLLKSFADYCIRFSPMVAMDKEDGLILDASGCSSLWGGDLEYITAIINRFKGFGYYVQAAMADTIGAAWAITHFGNGELVIKKDQHKLSLLSLSAAALRLESDSLELLYKLGFREISSFINMPRAALRRRFGNYFVQRLGQALGNETEIIQPVEEPVPYQERLSSLELILTAKGIEIALKNLLETLCLRLRKENKGIRKASFKCFRIDANIQTISIGTNLASNSANHLFRLFELKLPTIEPALGIELFILEAEGIEDVLPTQQKLWLSKQGFNDNRFSEFIDRVTNKIGEGHIHRYIPDEHYWPERSFKPTSHMNEQVLTSWREDKQRPLQILSRPEQIEVTAPIPDYPPMLFRYKGNLHKIKKADGPERIEREWWIEDGPHRDYYCVEDEKGSRYWLYRLGHYSNDKKPKWFIHGFFA